MMDINSATAQPVNIEARIKEEQLRLCYRQLPLAVFLPPVSGFMLAFLLWDHVDQLTNTIWLVAVFSSFTLLGGWVVWNDRNSDPRKNPDIRTLRLVVFSITSCGTWGIGGYVLFTPDSLGYIGLLFLWMYIPVAIVTISSIAYKPAFYSSAPLMLFPLMVRCLVEGGVLYITLALTAVLYMGCLYYLYTQIHHMLMESIRLRFEKSDLLKEVTLRKEAAEHANLAKSRFLAAANHDLRQPLHAQTLFVAELKHRVKDKESVQLIEHLESSIESMSGLFSSLLEISKLDAATIESNINAWSMSMILDELEVQFSSAVKEKGLKFRVVPCALTIYSDRLLLGRILQNLVANAIRYTNSGSVMVCCRQLDGYLRIEVRDSGPGIAEDKHTEIFDEFSQLHNPERDRGKGLGLGLAIVSRLGQLLNHKISLRSSPGKGSVFSVTVPTYKNSSHTNTQLSTTDAHEHNTNGINVLVIDNESLIRIGTQRLLSDWGCSVVTAAGYDDAVRTLARENFAPQVIISDYRLPDNETGIDTLDKLRRHFSQYILGILITGDTAVEVLQKADKCGYHVLHKPVSLEKLRLLVSSAIQDSKN